MYKIKNPRILYTTTPGIALVLYRTGNTALGCRARLNSKNPFLIKIRWRTTLTPPEVLPAEPPKNIIPKKKTSKNGVHKV